MKKVIRSLLAVILLTSCAFAQTATINFNIKNSPFSNYQLSNGNILATGEMPSFPFDQKGQAIQRLNITRPCFLTFRCHDRKTNKYLNQLLFVSPGDKLLFEADMLKKENRVTITGKGSNNNQPLPDNWVYFDGEAFEGDTTPNRIIKKILKDESELKAKLAQYVALHKPSADFIKIQKTNLDYWALSAYFDFKENNKFRIREAYKRNLPRWQSVQDSLLKKHPLDNPAALLTPTYPAFVTNFLLREKERLWEQAQENGEAFYKEWYRDRVAGEKEFAADMSNALGEKIINRYFKGKTAEYLYAHLIVDAIGESNPKNIPAIYNRFKNKYANSKYDPIVKPMVAEVEKRQRQALNNRMLFADSTGTQFSTFEDLLKLAENKTVLVDMWGTWCSPCREEIEKHSAGIKKHFKDKNLQYFYVANYDTNNKKSWKELIAYFNLEGTHILASQALTESVMKTVKGEGFPTYFVIKKDGTYELSKAGYPMKREKLIQQLEDALNR